LPTEPPHRSGVQALDTFARKLRRVDTYQQLIELVRDEVSARFGLTNAWLYVCEGESDTQLVLVAAAGARAAAIREIVPVIPRAGDALVEALLRDDGAVVIPDAQAGPFPEVTRILGNRTVVNMPMSVVDHALGILGCGTFGDEGIVAVGEAATEGLVQMAHMTSVALAGLVLRQREKEREELHARLAQRQRLESLGLLAGGVAHDFNNLLTVIRLSAKLIGEEPLSANQWADLRLIQDADESATQLTQKLLMLGRKQPLTIATVDLNTVVSSFMLLLRRLLPANIETDFIAGAGLPRLQLDAHQVEQVLMNLSLNARDAMPGGGRLTIETQQVLVNGDYQRAHPWAKAGRYVLLTVSDTGTGMPHEITEQVFEPFFTTKAPGEGTGLGLSQVYGFIKQSGGHLKIYSEPGEGTTVKLYLPRLAGTDAGEVPVQAPPIAAETAHGTILAVEDNADALAFTAEVLGDLGYRVLVAADAAAALQLLDREPEVDLLFTDVGLPHGVNGRQLADEATRRWPRLKVLYTTGYTRNAIVHHNRLDPGVELLVKPFTQSDLAAKIKRVLANDGSVALQGSP